MLLRTLGIDLSKIGRNAALALRSLWLHKLRAFLSVLGIIIGTSAVIALMSFGEGSMQDALEDIKRQGATNIIIRSVKPPDEQTTGRTSFVVLYGITQKDYERFETIENVIRLVPMRIFQQQVRHLDRMHPNARVVGTTPTYQEVNQLHLASGRFLIDDDDRKTLNVVVLACGIADRLFPYSDPINETVTIGTNHYKVIGVLKERMPTGGTGGSQAAEDYNNDIYMPLQTCRRRFGETIIIRQSGSISGERVELSQITLTMEADVTKPDGREKVRALGNHIRDILEKAHLKKDWVVTVPLDKLEEAERAQSRFTRLMGVIALISLLVGGIGIMNIMLATVTERTREIGIRRALGAKRRDITSQFLIEAVVQTTTGGLVGVALGLGAVFLLPIASQSLFDAALPALVHVPSIFMAFGFSILVGVLFGLYPALRAAKLDPIEALRHE